MTGKTKNPIIVIGILIVIAAITFGVNRMNKPAALTDEGQPKPPVATETAAEEATDAPVITPEPTEEVKINPQQVETARFELTYSGELADRISYRELTETEEDDMLFTFTINDTEYALFTLILNSSEGDMVTVLTDNAGNRVPVAFNIEQTPVKLSAEDARMYATVQEAVNEIVSSLILK